MPRPSDSRIIKWNGRIIHGCPQSSSTSEEVINDYAQLEWIKDQRGFIIHFEYDLPTVALRCTLGCHFSPPAGRIWSTAVSAALDLWDFDFPLVGEIAGRGGEMPVAWELAVRAKSLLIPGESGMAALVQFLEPETAGDGLSLESLDAIGLVAICRMSPPHWMASQELVNSIRAGNIIFSSLAGLVHRG